MSRGRTGYSYTVHLGPKSQPTPHTVLTSAPRVAGCRAQEAPPVPEPVPVLVQPQLRAPKVPVQEGAEALRAPAVQVQGVHSAAGARCFAVQCTHGRQGEGVYPRCDVTHIVISEMG